jgi:dephospho-CoA kinase
MLRVGLTGGLASGKSTIRRLFGELGCFTVDADSLVTALYQPGQAGHEALVGTYGDSILLPDGQVDRPRLSAIAFASPEEAKRLNALIHPIVVTEQARLIAEAEAASPGGRGIYVVEATLLLESGGRARFQRIVVVDVAPEVQLDRAVARGMDPAEASRRMAHQMPREERLRYADYVIDNNGDLHQADEETRRVYERLRAEAF